MKISKESMFNSIVLIGVGLWGYFDVMSPTALIPVFFGIALLSIYFIGSTKPGFAKIGQLLSLVLTVLILVALAGMRLPKSLDAGGVGLIRVIIMITSSSVASWYLIKVFFQK